MLWLCPWQDDICIPAHLLQEEATRKWRREGNIENKPEWQPVGRCHDSAPYFVCQPEERWLVDHYPLPAVTPRLCALKVSFLLQIKRARGQGGQLLHCPPTCCKKHVSLHLPHSLDFPGQQSIVNWRKTNMFPHKAAMLGLTADHAL